MRDNYLHLLFVIFASSSPSLHCMLGRLWFFVFLFYNTKAGMSHSVVCSEGPRCFVRTQCCVTVQAILTLLRPLPYKGIQVKSGAFTCFLMEQAIKWAAEITLFLASILQQVNHILVKLRVKWIHLGFVKIQTITSP